MRIHRIPKHDREFVIIANKAIQDRRLSHTARGILALLLSLPDGVRMNVRTLADDYPQGRRAVERAVSELRLLGYWVTLTVRDERTHRIASTVDVYELPLPASAPMPGAPVPTRPVTGPVDTGNAGTFPSGEKDEGKHRERKGGEHPPFPPVEPEPAAAPAPAPEPAPEPEAAPPAPQAAGEGHSDPTPDLAPTPDLEPDPAPDLPQAAEAARVLRGLASVDARLRLSARQVARLVPSVADWLDRGATVTEILDALTQGLPRTLYSAPAVLADRLARKRPARRRRWKTYADCADGCGRLLPEGRDSGSCGACAGGAEPPVPDPGPRPQPPSGPLAPEGFAAFRAARGSLPGDRGRRAAEHRPGGPLAPRPAAGVLV
ncbi:helix-turn-helix domain-containing protein [Streptomyces hydrogenans]|uniref:helix-turn-helix domain-containing protein n=1 Tax=Streptomyces hydrogenans TaxID=1873719 RepID=UPI00380FD814